jgi:YD repeat-containing protein
MKYKHLPILAGTNLYLTVYFYEDNYSGKRVVFKNGNTVNPTSDHVHAISITNQKTAWNLETTTLDIDTWTWGTRTIREIIQDPDMDGVNDNSIKYARLSAAIWRNNDDGLGYAEGNSEFEFAGVVAGNSSLGNVLEEKYSISKTHVDALGKPLQTISSEGGGKYIASEVLYDELGRSVGGTQTVRYTGTTEDLSLKENLIDDGFILGEAIPITSDVRTMNTNTDAYPYAMQTFYDDPLSRPKKSSSPGETWKINTGKNLEMAYATNTGAVIVDGYSYPANELYVEAITDEDGIVSETYSDKNGNVIKTVVNVKSPQNDPDTENITTYNVYDERNNLIKTISPKGEATYFKYDAMNQLISKSSPDYDADNDNNFSEQSVADFEYVNDRLGRLRLWRDPAHIAGKDYSGTVCDWLYNKFDLQGRVIESGLLDNNSDRATIETSVYAESKYYEEDDYRADFATNPVAYTSTNSFPTSGTISYSISYYDDYNLDADLGGVDDVTIPAGLNHPQNRLTATYTKEDIYGTWDKYIRELYFYDKYGRVGEYRIKYPDDRIGEKTFKFNYDIQGTITDWSYQSGKGDALYYWYEYDTPGRLYKVFISNNSIKPSVAEATYTYNAQGQVERMILGNNVQGVDYRYNKRGWLTGINKETNDMGSNPENDGGTNSNLPPDRFAMILGYDQVNSNIGLALGAQGKYNGNITWIEWQTYGIDNNDYLGLKGYVYKYDGINQLTKADYSSWNATWDLNDKAYDVENLDYDKHGNLYSLKRYSWDSEINQSVLMDDLTYNYDASVQNRLTSISDAVGQVVSSQEANSSSYTYDINGNLITDSDKNITNIIYDHRNLPLEIQFASGDKIYFKYDASGNRIYKGTSDGNEEFYIRDLSGREVAIYDEDGNPVMFNMYGLSLIGKLSR